MKFHNFNVANLANASKDKDDDDDHGGVQSGSTNALEAVNDLIHGND